MSFLLQEGLAFSGRIQKLNAFSFAASETASDLVFLEVYVKHDFSEESTFVLILPPPERVLGFIPSKPTSDLTPRFRLTLSPLKQQLIHLRFFLRRHFFVF